MSEAARPRAASARARTTAPQANKLYRGDCIDLMRAWPGGSFDACIADPPYNMSRRKGLGWAFSSHVTMAQEWDRFSDRGYFDFTRAWLTEVARLVKRDGNILVFGSFHNIYLIGFVLQNVLGLRVMQQITWFKPNAQPNITGRLPTESSEYIIWACNNSPDRASHWTFDYPASKKIGGGKQLRNVWSIPCTPRSEKSLGNHPTQKPLALLERIVTLWTRPRDLVLDCFLGTGTTAVAAQRLKRRWVGIEKDRKYFAVANARLRRSA